MLPCKYETRSNAPPTPSALYLDKQGTKYKQVVGAAAAYAKEVGVDESHVYIWIDFASVDQDNDADLVRGVNSLGLYVASADAFVTIEHPSYFDRGKYQRWNAVIRRALELCAGAHPHFDSRTDTASPTLSSTDSLLRLVPDGVHVRYVFRSHAMLIVYT